MTDLKSQVGAALKAARVQQGLTMQQLADRLGVSGTTTISRYESGKLNLSLQLIERIAKAMNLAPQIIFESFHSKSDN